MTSQYLKIRYARVVTKAASNTHRKSISTVVRKEPKKSYCLIHHLLKPLKLTKVFQSPTYCTRSLTEAPSKLVIVV